MRTVFAGELAMHKTAANVGDRIQKLPQVG